MDTDMEVVVHANASECQRICRQRKDCTNFVYDTTDGPYKNSCWLKKTLSCTTGFGNGFSKSTGKFSGPKFCDFSTSPPYALRLESKIRFDAGMLLVADVEHMPSPCGVWPALWLLGEEPWPTGGEIDIIENVGGDFPFNSVDHTTLHTDPECVVGGSDTNYSMKGGIFYTKDCAKQSTGCLVVDTNLRSFGSSFNSAGGGVYALLWTSKSIQAWFWSRHGVPADIQSNAISATSVGQWGSPYANFVLGPKCNANHFKHMKVVVNTDFCGDMAGADFKLDCPVEGVKVNGASYFVTNSAQDNCKSYVSSTEGRQRVENDAYWTLRKLQIYKYPSDDKVRFV